MSEYTTIWSTVHQNFKDCLEDSTTGVNSLTSISTHYTESELEIDLKNEQSSVFHGAYVVQLDSINNVTNYLSSGTLVYEYNVRLQLGYELNTNDKAVSYHQALSDTEEVIRHRLTPTTWNFNAPDGIIKDITFNNNNKVQPVVKNDQFVITETVFKVLAQTNTNN
jgi:hypothetical protein